MKFPVTVRHRTGKVKIYAPAKSFPYYRMCFTAVGKRQMQTFGTYTEAHTAAEKKAKELHTNSAGASLTATQAQDALAAIERLNSLYQSNGRKFSLFGAVTELADAITKLRGHSLNDAVVGYLRTVVMVKTKVLSEAVEEFITSRQHQTESRNGKRAQLSASYATHVNSWLREFSDALPGTAVCDLGKDHLNAYMKSHTDVGAKNRNDRRAALKMFLNWTVRNDYLPNNHRLFEADGMMREVVEATDTDFYRPDELQKLLDDANAEVRPVIAIAGFAGLRGAEIMRLDWADVWRVEGHIEIKSGKAKTRQRRLVKMCPALTSWLKDFKSITSGNIFAEGVHVYQRAFVKLRNDLKIPARRNGLRHAFCTYHFALHANENLTAAQAGNSPAMIHAHYKGLATKAEAEKWFAVQPAEIPKQQVAA